MDLGVNNIKVECPSYHIMSRIHAVNVIYHW